MREAIGLVETIGLVGAVEALDVAVKSANVRFLDITYVRNGQVTITISGDVGAVKAAIESSEHATRKLGCYISSHVIPRPSDDVYDLLNKNINVVDELLKDKNTQKLNNNTDLEIKKEAETENDTETAVLVKDEVKPLELEILSNENFENFENLEYSNNSNISQISSDDIELEPETLENYEELAEKSEVKANTEFSELKVSELKDYIYSNIGGYSKNELKKMNKEKLIDIAVNHAN